MVHDNPEDRGGAAALGAFSLQALVAQGAVVIDRAVVARIPVLGERWSDRTVSRTTYVRPRRVG